MKNKICILEIEKINEWKNKAEIMIIHISRVEIWNPVILYNIKLPHCGRG